MPRHRHNSSESSSDDDSSDDSSQKRNKKRRQHSSQDRQRHRNQRSDSSDSGHDSKMIRSKVNLNQKSNRSGGRKRRSVSVESDRSPVRERKDGSKSRQAEAQRRDRKRRSSSGDSSGSENRKKRSNRKRSPSEKRERRKHSDSDSEEPSSPTKPVLASRVNYMKSLNPDRSKWMPKKKSPSRRKVQSLADDYMRGEQQSSRWRVESLADDYRKDRYRNSSRGDRDRKDERGKGRDERSPRRKSPKGSQIRSAERHSFDRSPRRSPKRRSRDRSLEKNISPERKPSEVKRRSPRRSPLQRSPHMQISPKRRSPERSPKRHRSADRQRSSFKGSVEKARSPDRQKAPVRRSPARRSQDRQSSPLRRSTERQRARLRKSLEKSPTPQSPDRQATRSLDRQRSLELHSPVKRVPVRRPPLQRNQRRQSPEERSIQRLSAERIYAPQDRQEADPRSSVRRLSGRPLARRRSEEDLSSRFSPEGSFVQRASIDRPLSRRSPGISPLRPLSRRRSSAERSFPVRRSLEGNVNQRYLALSPPRPTEPRIRARSLERISRRTDTDRLSQREMQPNIFRRFRRDSDRGLYDDLPEPMGIRSPPIERRWREEPEYLNRYRDDMDLPQRSVYVDRDVNVRVLNDRSDESDERTFRYRDHRGNKAFNRPRPSQFQGRRQQRNDEPFRFMENRNWRSERNELHETDADNHRSAEMIEPKRRRLDVNIRRGSLSPTRGWGRSGENPRAVIISRSRSPVSPERNRENRNATRNASRSSSESEEESPAHGSKLSSTVTMVSRKEKHVRSPPMQLKNDKVKKTSSEEHDRIRSSRRQSYSPQRLKRETMDHLRMEKDKLVPLKKRSRSPEQSVRGRNNTDVLEMDKSDKKSLKSPRKSKRDHTATKDRSVSSRKSSRSPLQSPTRPMDSNRSATERGRSDRSIRSNQLSPKERLDSVTSEQEQEFTRAFEMERMDSMVSEQDFGRSFERERFDSTASEQEMLQRSQSIDVEEEGRDNVDDYESGPESGELTDSDEEAAKKNALIKSLVNKPSLEELDADEEERQRLEDQHYLEEKRQQALERIEAEKETVASKVVKVTDSRKDKEERRERGRDDKRDNKRKRHAEDVSGSKPDTSQLEQEPVPKKKPKPDPTGAEALTMRTGGAYIPPAKLRAMQESITDKSSVAYQRMSWEALKKSINGLINKVNVSNIEYIVRELFQENIVRGRGLMARSIIQAQAASPTFTHVYAALVAIVNTKFPQNGELILRRLVIQFRRGFKRNDKSICLSTTRFVAHLVNQQVAHEVLALEILTLLLETPTDDSVEIAVGFLKECGQKLTEVTPRGINAIFERLRNVLHEGQIDIRVQYMVEVMFAVRKDGFKDHPSVLEDLDLVEEEDQFTHLLTLEDAGDPENMLNVFKADPDFLENEEKYKILKKEILDEGSSDEEGEGGSGSDSDSEDSEGEEGEGEKQAIIDNTETNLVALRRTIYLTIQSSLDFEECAHKLMKMELKPGQESELCYMVLDCCAQMRTYEKFFGLLAQRFCMIDKKYIAPFQTMFKEQYDTIHRLETNKLRNVAKFFAHLLHTDAISWEVLSCIRLNEEETTSASRIFIKILVQELSEYMGLPNLNERLKDPTLQESFEGLLPRDNPRNTRFAINFFTTIGLGGLTDDLRDHLKNVSKKLMEQKQQEEEAAESSSSTQSESSASESSSEESSDSSEEERKKKKKKRGDKVKDKAKNKKDKHGKKSVANGTVEKEKRGKKLRKGKSGVQEESAQKRAERLRQLANYNANAGQVDPEISRSKDLDSNGDRRSGRDSSRSHKEDRISRTRDNERRDSFDRPRDPSEDREVRGRRDRILSDDEHYREQDMETGRRDYRAVQRQVSYEDGDRNQRRRIDRSFDKGDRYDNRYESLDNLNARNDNFRQSYDGRGRNQYRNFNVGDNRRQKGGYAAGNLGYRNIRGRNRGDGRMDRNLGRNRSEERTTHAARDDRRDDRRRR